jgi:DHA2 family multidrug resistance protein
MTTPTGFLAARFGRTRLFAASIIGFTIASILCGLAQSLSQIVIFRILQGICGASLVPLSQSVMFDIYPIERRGAAMALWGMGVQIGPVLGPMLFLKDTSESKTAKLDWIGFAALSIAIGAFQLMLDRGETLDWFSSPEIILEACLAGVGLYIFIVQFSLSPRPFITPRIFTDLNFVIGIIFIFIVGLILFATLALLAPYLQTLMNYPVVTAGVGLAPRGVGTMGAMIIGGRLVSKVSPRVLVSFGFLANALALYDMMYWTPDISEWTIISVGLIQGVGIGFVFVPLSLIAFTTMPAELRTEATGIFSLMRNLGSAIGISVTSALLTTNTEINHAIITGVVTPFNRALQTGAARHFWNPASDHGAALLNAQITRQANIIAYVDDFKLMFILTVLTLPLVLFIRPNKTRVATAPHDAVME